MARNSNGSRSADRVFIPQTAGNVKQEDIADEMSEEEEAAYNSDEDMPIQQQVFSKYIYVFRFTSAEGFTDLGKLNLLMVVLYPKRQSLV